MCGSSLSVLVKVQTTSETEHPVTESVRTVKGIHRVLEDQDNEAEILRTIVKTVKYGTYCLVGNSEEGRNTLGSCKNECKSRFSKKHNYMGRHVDTTTGWTHSKWLKRMVKDHVV